MKVAILVRVSSKSDRQDYDRQISDLKAVAKKNNWTIVKIVTAKISATKSRLSTRLDIAELYDLVEAKSIQKVLVTELSRLGRMAREIREVYEFLQNNGIAIFIQSLRIIWNFPDTETLTIEGNSQFWGSLVIPSRTSSLNLLEVPGFNGRLMAGGDVAHVAAGSEFHNYSFEGDLSSICAVAACTIVTDGLASVACTGTDAISFSLNPNGTLIGASYNVTVNGGTATSISPTSGTYGAATTFTLNDNSAGGGDVTITLTDVDDATCTRVVTVTDPEACASTCPAPNCTGVTIIINN